LFLYLFLCFFVSAVIGSTSLTNQTVNNSSLVMMNNSSTHAQPVIEEKINWSEVPQFDFSG